MESTSATTPPHPTSTSLLFDKLMNAVPPPPQLEHHRADHGSPASTPSPTNASPTSLIFSDLIEDKPIVVDTSDNDDDHQVASPVEDDSLVRSPATAMFPVSPSLGDSTTTTTGASYPAGSVSPSAIKPRPSPNAVHRSLSQLGSLSLSTRSLSQSQTHQLLLSPSFAALQTPVSLSPSRRSTAGSPIPSPTILQPQQGELPLPIPGVSISSSPQSLRETPPPGSSNPHQVVTSAEAPTENVGTQAISIPSKSSVDALDLVNRGTLRNDQVDDEEADEREVENVLNKTITAGSAAITSEKGVERPKGTVSSGAPIVVVDEGKKEEQKEMSTSEALTIIGLYEAVAVEGLD